MLKWLIALPFAAFILFNAYVYGSILTYRAVAPHHSAFMTMRMNEFRSEGREVALDYRWVPYNRISVNLKKALIASEDAAFAEHGGFDWNGIEHAMRRNQRSGTIRAGGSTISQQLAKNLFLFAERSYVRKAEEAVITVMMESMWSKERILTVYLNVAEFGEGIYGIEAAAQHYYHKPASRLRAGEAASLIAMLPNPKYFQQHRNDRHLRNKTRIILRRMGSADLPPDEE